MDLECPVCASKEMHPTKDLLLLRVFKVQDASGYWWSQCLVCAGYYDNNLEETPDDFDSDLGWF